MAEMTPIPVTTNLCGIEFLQEKIGQLADVFGLEQRNHPNRQAKPPLHDHGDFGAIHRIGAQIDQPVGLDELMRVEARQYFSRMLRDEIEQFHLSHNKLSAIAESLL